ncbi:lysoplasmalogenase [Chitinimonas sp. BJYL2]|uniref:lysoplasmalogenase n=1 Tax=Chitinimonas sp. BJYL2 TaxID=2976696 RepID=UPI0022B564A6|nr:lysoplasmalogenase [Chitinimonas sp. BJYL2]
MQLTTPRNLAVVGLIGLVIHLAARAIGPHELEFISKLIPVSCMMLWISHQAGRYAKLILVGLGLSLLGDALLAWSPSQFIGGLVAFLCAHVCYVMAFVQANRKARIVRLLPILLWLGAIFAVLYPTLGVMAAPVAAYVLVIGAMLWRAIALVEQPAERWQLAAAAGALLFGISDSVLAINKFHTEFAAAGYIVMLTYWAGQWGIARSVFREQAGN